VLVTIYPRTAQGTAIQSAISPEQLLCRVSDFYDAFAIYLYFFTSAKRHPLSAIKKVSIIIVQNTKINTMISGVSRLTNAFQERLYTRE